MLLMAQIAGAVAWIAVISGIVLLHVRLRNLASTSFVLSLVVTAVWAAWGQAAINRVLFPPPPAKVSTGQGESAEALIAIGQSYSIEVVSDSILMLWVGISFFFAIKSIRSQRVA